MLDGSLLQRIDQIWISVGEFLTSGLKAPNILLEGGETSLVGSSSTLFCAGKRSHYLDFGDKRIGHGDNEMSLNNEVRTSFSLRHLKPLYHLRSVIFAPKSNRVRRNSCIWFMHVVPCGFDPTHVLSIRQTNYPCDRCERFEYKDSRMRSKVITHSKLLNPVSTAFLIPIHDF